MVWCESQAVVKNVARDGQRDDEGDNARDRSVEHERENTLPKWVRKEEDGNTGQSATRNRLSKHVDGIVVCHWNVEAENSEKPHAKVRTNNQPSGHAPDERRSGVSLLHAQHLTRRS